MKLNHVVAFVCFMAIATWAGAADSDYRFYRLGFGGGYTIGQDGADSNPDGVFLVWRAVCKEDGATLEASLSKTSGLSVLTSSFLKTEFLRVGMDFGYTFNRAGKVRPFATAGFAVLRSEATMSVSVFSARVIDDHSLAVTLGVGIEAGEGALTFYAKLLKDFNYNVDLDWFGVPVGSLDLDSEQFRIGYVYRY